MEQERNGIEAECTRVLIALYRHLDLGEIDAAVALCHADAIWHGRAAVPMSELKTLLQHRPIGARIHTIVTNLLFETDTDECRFSAYLTAVVANGESLSQKPPAPEILRLYLCEGTLRHTASGWRLYRHRAGVPRMELLGPGIKSDGCSDVLEVIT